MPRVFIGLGLGGYFLVVAAAYVGLLKPEDRPDLHVLLAVFALLVCVLVQAAFFTYLSVAGKLIAQALHLGGLELSPLAILRRLKRAGTRCVFAVVISVVLVTATGGATWREGGESPWHLISAAFLFVVSGASLFREYVLTVEASGLLRQTLDAYNARKKLDRPRERKD